MQTAQGVTSRMTAIVLHEMGADACRRKFLGMPGFKKRSARIAEHPRLDHDHFGQFGRLELHYRRSVSSPFR